MQRDEVSALNSAHLVVAMKAGKRGGEWGGVTEGGACAGSSAVLVRGMSSRCAHASSSVGGLIHTHALFTPVQSGLARMDICWRSWAGRPGGQRFGPEGFRAAEHCQGLRWARASALNSGNLMVAVKAYRHGGE